MTQLSNLKPFRSFIVARVAERNRLPPIVNRVLDDVQNLLDFDEKPSLELVDLGRARNSGDLVVGFIHYEQSKTAPWSLDSSIRDTINHLFLVTRLDRFLAMYTSDSGLKRYLSSFSASDEYPALAALLPIEERILNAAFVAGAARTLWLSGTHRRTSVKADNKVLSGLDLRDALDPLDDQTYHFTAARSLPIIGQDTLLVGVTPTRSSIWLGMSRDWPEVRESAEIILGHLANPPAPVEAPLPILARNTVDISHVADPFDIAVVPPELAAEVSNGDEDERARLERWGYDASFHVLDVDGQIVTVEPHLKGERIGLLDIRFDWENPAKVTWSVEQRDPSAGNVDLLSEARRMCERPGWLKVWFDSGHTLSEGRLYEMVHRDVQFDGYVWGDFDNYDIGKEKPDPISDTGTSDSLFCWVQKRWPEPFGQIQHLGGWLACDDRAGETADFISINLVENPARLSLIHVKGAGSAAPDRGISVAEYEVVVAQAIKNLRHLDRILLGGELHRGLGHKISELVWLDRQLSGRVPMLAVMEQLGSNYQREVVIVQPRHRRQADESARARPTSANMARLRQLDTLLVAAAGECRALGAPLRVICDGR